MNAEPRAAGHLVLSVNLPAGRRVWNPLSWLDLGHVDVLLWEPPRPPESFGLYVATGRLWDVALSAFRARPGRCVRSSGWPAAPTRWRTWDLSPAALDRLRTYLEQIAAGTTRYHALRFTCFHFAHRCLEIAGTAPPPLSRARLLWTGAISARSFLAAIMPGAPFSSLAAGLGHRHGRGRSAPGESVGQHDPRGEDGGEREDGSEREGSGGAEGLAEGLLRPDPR